MDLAPGTRVLERYVVESLVGEGGMGQVYRGHHAKLGFPVAFKVLTGRGTESLARFEREARLMARVRHVNVVAVLDYGTLDDGTPCIAMEHVEGESLDALVRRRQSLPWTEALRISMGILGGVEAIHAASILHRDLKPSNVLLLPGRPETVKLIDFGISKPQGPDVTQHTRTGMMVGTPAFMPPEVFLDRPFEPRSDLYAAGLILHLMVTGSVPFVGDTVESVLRRAILPVPQPMAPPGQPPLPASLVQVMVSVLSIEPDLRPRSASDLAAALHAIASFPGPAASAPPPPAAQPPLLRQMTPGTTHAPVLPSPSPPTAIGRGLGVESAATAIVAARLPPSRLASPEDRRWLADLAAQHGRAFTIGSGYWFAVLSCDDETRAARVAGSIVRALEGRYGATGAYAWCHAGEGFSLTAASLTGAAPLPEEIRSLVRRLSE